MFIFSQGDILLNYSLMVNKSLSMKYQGKFVTLGQQLNAKKSVGRCESFPAERIDWLTFFSFEIIA